MESWLRAQAQRTRVEDLLVMRTAELRSAGTGHRPVPTQDPSRQGHCYCSDLGSERFFGVFLFKSATSSCALGGFFTLFSRMISLALPSERKVEPSSETPANNPLERE